jgi:hypothetical protein
MMTSKETLSAGRETCLSVTFMHHIYLMDCRGIRPERATMKMEAVRSSETTWRHILENSTFHSYRS